MTKTEVVYMFAENFKDKTDENLILDIRQEKEGALEVLFSRYKDLINMKVSRYFIIGAERDDIVQEGLIGLYKAIQSFDGNKQNSFKSFANLCIERQLITAIKTSNRQKHIPLNSSLSLNSAVYDNEEDTSLIEVFNSKTVEDPLETITKKEYYSMIENQIDKTLSSFEKKVLTRFARGESYIKIAENLDAPVKAIDNAIQRIRKKTNKNLQEG